MIKVDKAKLEEFISASEDVKNYLKQQIDQKAIKEVLPKRWIERFLIAHAELKKEINSNQN